MTSMAVERSSALDAGQSPIAAVFGVDGISTSIKLQSDELEELRRLTTECWLRVLHKHAPDYVDQFEAGGIQNYHRLAHLVDHANIWTTTTRTFPAEVADKVRSFSLFDFYDRTIPAYQVGTAMPPYGDFGRTRINWRLVRPGAGVDLGPIHADYWFDAVLDGWTDTPGPLIRLKTWIPIFLEEGVTGFAYVPGSHLRNFKFRKKRLSDGVCKPDFDEKDLPAPLQTVASPIGTAVLFNYNLVHRGANSDAATQTRVSMEFTLDIPRDEMEKRYGPLDRFY
jgi:hypothetical protein